MPARISHAASDEKIKQQQKRPDEKTGQKKNFAAAHAAAGHASEGMEKLIRNYFKERFFAKAVERAHRSVPRKISAEHGEFVMYPQKNVVAAAPHHCRAQQKKDSSEK